MNTWQKRCSVENSFPLPYEVFELGLARGALLVYVYLVYHKSLRHTLTPIRQVLKERERELLTELNLAEAQRKWAEKINAMLPRPNISSGKNYYA